MGLSIAKISDEQLEVEREGIWVPILCTLEDMTAVEFLVRYWATVGGDAEFLKRLHRNQGLAAGANNDAQTFKLIAQKKALVQMCLGGWRTVEIERTGDDENPYKRVRVIREDEIEFEKGNWVPYSQHAALRLVGNAWRDIYDALQSAAHDDQGYRDYLESTAKNLPSSSDGNSKISENSSPSSEAS